MQILLIILIVLILGGGGGYYGYNAYGGLSRQFARARPGRRADYLVRDGPPLKCPSIRPWW